MIHKDSEIPRSSGDEPGTPGGMISGVNMGKATFKKFSTKVRIEGSDAVTRLAATGQNGANPNAFGAQASQRETTVIITG